MNQIILLDNLDCMDILTAKKALVELLAYKYEAELTTDIESQPS